jgi:hypothetical protein
VFLWLWCVFLVDNQVLYLAFLICSDNPCILIGEWSPFTFRVLIVRYLLIPVFLSLSFLVESLGIVHLEVLLIYWVGHDL